MICEKILEIVDKCQRLDKYTSRDFTKEEILQQFTDAGIDGKWRQQLTFIRSRLRREIERNGYVHFVAIQQTGKDNQGNQLYKWHRHVWDADDYYAT